MEMKPSNIFYSQRDITDTFGRSTRHSNTDIGDTLDDIYYGRTSICSIPTITVAKKDGKWFTLDNRRLWIFHHLEAAGKCDTIPVNVTDEISARKFTTQNGGVSVTIYRGRDPGGKCHRFIKPVTPRIEGNVDTTSNVTPRIEENVNCDTTSKTDKVDVKESSDTISQQLGEALVNGFAAASNPDTVEKNKWSDKTSESDETRELESANATLQSSSPSSVEERSVFENEREKQEVLKIETKTVPLGTSDICSNDLEMVERKSTRTPDNINIEEQHDCNAENTAKISNDLCLDDFRDQPVETKVDKTMQVFENHLQQGESGMNGSGRRLANEQRLKRYNTQEPGEKENVPLPKSAKFSYVP